MVATCSWIHGRVDDAAVEARKATELDPMDPHSHQWLGIILCLGNRPSDAIEPLHRALEIEGNWIANHYLGLSYRLTGTTNRRPSRIGPQSSCRDAIRGR